MAAESVEDMAVMEEDLVMGHLVERHTALPFSHLA